LGGWFAIHFNLFTKEDYFAYAGIVGGLASVAGLFALTRPAITQSDFQALELSTIKSMTETATQLQELESARKRTKGQLVDLEQKKKEMELLVKKASLALFLKEQYVYHEKQVLDEINRNDKLKIELENAHLTSEKLIALNEEIEVNPNVLLLKEIIDSASRRQPTLDEVLNDLPPFTRVIVKLAGNILRF
jgi:hypothetical protein